MKRIPAGFLLEGFQIEGTAKGMHSLAGRVHCGELSPLTVHISFITLERFFVFSVVRDNKKNKEVGSVHKYGTIVTRV